MRTTRFHSRIIALVVVIAGSLLASVPASAGGITVVENDVDHSFGQHVTFTLEASSDAEISQIYLFFHATDDDETEKEKVALEEPGRQVSVRHVHNARIYPLPPFATITYWWQIEDGAPPSDARRADRRVPRPASPTSLSSRAQS